MIGLACSGKEIYPFCFVLLCILRANSKYKPPGGLIFGGLIQEGAYFRNFTVYLYFYLSIVTLKCNVNNEIKTAMDNLKQKFDAH